jgi:hypothetical protein
MRNQAVDCRPGNRSWFVSMQRVRSAIRYEVGVQPMTRLKALPKLFSDSYPHAKAIDDTACCCYGTYGLRDACAIATSSPEELGRRLS